MIIGEAPGEWEEHLGRPFVGDSGQKLMEALTDAGASRAEFYITNVYKLRPLEDRFRNGKLGGQAKNRPPTRREIGLHSPCLGSEFDAVRPCAVLLLGANALHTLLKLKGLEERAGKQVPRHGRVYLPTFHPSYVLQN
jgi:uracil-DNA glycosylase family 4